MTTEQEIKLDHAIQSMMYALKQIDDKLLTLIRKNAATNNNKKKT